MQPTNAGWPELRETSALCEDAAEVGGMAAMNGITAEDVLAWLRRLPTGLGPRHFFSGAGLRGQGRARPMSTGIPAPDPDFHDPETDELTSFLAELDRVCPTDMRPEGFGLEFSCGWGDAAAILRKLPDGAGSQAVARALERGSP